MEVQYKECIIYESLDSQGSASPPKKPTTHTKSTGNSDSEECKSDI